MYKIHDLINEHPTWFSAGRLAFKSDLFQNLCVDIQSWALEKTEQDSWEDIQGLQLRRIQKLISHAYATTKFWKKHFDEANIHPDNIRGFEDFKRIPPVSKSLLKRTPLHERISYSIDRSRSYRVVTSGTTGAPIDILLDAWISERHTATRERGVRWLLGAKKEVDLGVRIGIRNNFYPGYKVFQVESFDQIREIKDQLQQLCRTHSCIISANPSTIFHLASLLQKEGNELSLKGIFLSGEDVNENAMKFMQETFKCPIARRYTCSESGSLAHECSNGNLHINADQQYIEVVNGTVEGVGNILLTDLNNFKTPTIRYDFGDLGAMLPPDSCPCGLPFPVIRFYGRDNLSFTLPNGKKGLIAKIFYPLLSPKMCPWILRFQVVRTGIFEFNVYTITTGKENALEVKKLKETLKQNLGGKTRVHIVHVPKIESEKGRKTQAFIL